MAEPAIAAQPAPPRLAPSPSGRRQVVVPEDLVALVGEERIRKFHAQLAQLLKALRADSTVQWKLHALAGGAVVDSLTHVEVPD